MNVASNVLYAFIRTARLSLTVYTDCPLMHLVSLHAKPFGGLMSSRFPMFKERLFTILVHKLVSNNLLNNAIICICAHVCVLFVCACVCACACVCMCVCACMCVRECVCVCVCAVSYTHLTLPTS